MRSSTRSAFPDWRHSQELNSIEPPWYGPVCPVVWEGRSREAPPYPDLCAEKRIRPAAEAIYTPQGSPGGVRRRHHLALLDARPSGEPTSRSAEGKARMGSRGGVSAGAASIRSTDRRPATAAPTGAERDDGNTAADNSEVSPVTRLVAVAVRYGFPGTGR